MKRIVIVDDHAGVRAALRAVLEAQMEWLVVAEAADGEQGLALTLQQRPDALILDLHLPRLGGLDVLERLQAQAPPTPVVLYTLSGEAHTVAAAYQAGAAAYVLKGVEPAELMHALHVALAGGRYLCQALRDHHPMW